MRQVGLAVVLASWVVTAVVTVEAAAQDQRMASSAAAISIILEEVAGDVSGEPGAWTATYRGSRIVVHAVDHHGRMRIMAPIASAADLDRAGLEVLLGANYGRALDAKFAIADGVVWSLFNRALEGLDRITFLDGIEQVVTLKENYGGSYRSTDLTFGRPPGDDGL